MKKTMCRFTLMTTVASAFLFSTPLFATETDDRIEASAKETYVFRTYLKDDNIKMQSKNGLVTLTGTVDEPSHKTLAEETVAGLPGVTGVQSTLVENHTTKDTKSDAWLITKVKTTLLFHKNVNASGTEVSGKNGTITLGGQATSTAQKDLTGEYAKDVEGVKNVKNKMTVANQIAPTDTTKMDAVIEAIDDTSITAMVKTTLLSHRSTSGFKTMVETKDGVVTLTGKARTGAEKDLAGKYASDVHGVKDISNNLIIE